MNRRLALIVAAAPTRCCSCRSTRNAEEVLEEADS